jgi:hypothetical protein
MALRPHNLLHGRLKMDFGEVDEAMFEGVEGICQIFFCVLGF